MTCVAFWPGGRALTGHEDGSVVLWDLAAGAELKRFAQERSRVTAVAVSPDGHHAVAALANHLVYLYRLPPAGP
jgi:WD40 repeat protein